MPIVLTNAENPDVPVGHIRLIFDMITNATWSDGKPITAEDVAFSMNYYHDLIQFGSISGRTLVDLTAAYAASPYRVVIEFNTPSYWDISNAGLLIVMPKHVLETVPVGQWDTYDPGGDHPFIVSGPFEVTQFIRGEFVEMTARTDWAYGVSRPTTTPESTNTTTNGGGDPMNMMGVLVGGAIGATSIVAAGGFAVLRKKPTVAEG